MSERWESGIGNGIGGFLPEVRMVGHACLGFQLPRNYPRYDI